MTDEPLEVEAEFILVTPPIRIELADLPLSPRKIFKAAEALGWEAHAWLATGWVPPTYYARNENGHTTTDEKSESYGVNLFTVEARDPASREVGFQAHFTGKTYQSDKKNTLGSFTSARIKDPVGIPRPARFEYSAITQTRGKFETEASINKRRASAQAAADNQNGTYNDGAWVWPTTFNFNTAGELDAWLAEWKGFTS